VLILSVIFLWPLEYAIVSPTRSYQYTIANSMAPHPISIAVINHGHAPRKRQADYLLYLLARLWERRGIRVHYLYGTSDFVKADVAFLHVDLSVVPQDYAFFARRYPIALNAKVLDIRKRRFSAISLNGPADYHGAVIVKTDLNAGGSPERGIRRETEPTLLRITRQALQLIWRNLGWCAPGDRIVSPFKYEIYPAAARVPADIYREPRLIVEKFVPERRGRWYCHRRYFFLADAEVNQLWLGTRPICANDVDGVTEDITEVPIPPALRDFRRRFGIDYGKIDYVLGKKGDIIVFDVNKTPSGVCRNPARDEWLVKLCGDLERGIDCLLRRPAVFRGEIASSLSAGNFRA
jgi:hypothetical protein